LDGNKEPVSLEKPKDARTYSTKTSNWTFRPIDAKEDGAETAETAETAKSGDACCQVKKTV